MGTTVTDIGKAKRKKPVAPRGTGRPPKEETQRIREKILDVAAVLFFAEGYGATSIEAVARRARISKRTIYHRFADKAELFRAVVHRVIERLRPANTEHLFKGKNLDNVLLGIARAVLNASLSKDALALHRIVLSEATRFPELALIMNDQGMRKEAIWRIADLLQRSRSGAFGRIMDSKYTTFAAEQFMQMVISVPQRRALGLGQPMSTTELEDWAIKSTILFLNGL